MSDITFQVLVKGEHRHIYVYREDQRADVLRTLWKHASDPQHPLNWFDAALLSARIRATEVECSGR